MSSTTTTVSMKARSRSGKARPDEREQPEREGGVRRHRDSPAVRGGAAGVDGQVDRDAAAAMPPAPASSGSAKRRRSRSSPRSNSRRASSPTTKKKNVIKPAVDPVAQVERDAPTPR